MKKLLTIFSFVALITLFYWVAKDDTSSIKQMDRSDYVSNIVDTNKKEIVHRPHIKLKEKSKMTNPGHPIIKKYNLKKIESKFQIGIAKGLVNENETALSKSPNRITSEVKDKQVGRNTIRRFDNKYKVKRQKVDILWVIDDSSSMSSNKKKMAAKLDIFIKQFLEKKVKFKMAFISTTVEKINEWNAKSFLDYRYARKNKDLFIQKFQNRVQESDIGSGREQGFLAVDLFLLNFGTEFLREKAEFVIVFVTDENDGSYNYHKTEEAVKRFIKNTKLFKRKFKIYGILENNPDIKQKRYFKVIQKTKGTWSKLEGNWHQTLLNIGGKIIESVEIKMEK